MCCTQLAENTGHKNDAKKSPSGHHRTTLSGWIFATKACIDNWEKLDKQQYFSTCPHNMANFSPLVAEMGSGVWGTRANFNGFRVLAALLHGTLVVGVSQTLRRWTEGATYIFSSSAITLGIGPHSSYHLSNRYLPNVMKINAKIKTMQNINTLLFVRLLFLTNWRNA